jgi:tetratricopeptide (TPR) repeat protein
LNTATLLARALAQRRAGKVASAESILRRIVAREPGHAEALHQLGTLLGAAGKVEDAAACFRRALAAGPDRPPTLKALGLACLALGRPHDAIEPFSRLAAMAPDDAAILATLGRAQYSAGRADDAFETFSRVLALKPNDSEAHWMTGSIRHAQGEIEAAEASYRAALAEKPDLWGAVFNLGLLLAREAQRPAEAVPLFERLVAAQPDHAEAYAELGHAYRAIQRTEPAVAAYGRHLDRHPQSAFAQLLMGQALSEAGRKDEALVFFERALEANPHRELRHLVNIDVGNVLQDLGRETEAREAFERALQLEPLLTRKAAKPSPDFSAVFVLMPGANNTPHDFLIDRARFESHVVLLLPERAYDIPFIARHADVVMNLVSDADQAGGLLSEAARFADALGKPVINHPTAVARTGRQSIAALLSHVPGCRVARIERRAASELARLPAYPFLARLVGRHGGDEFEMITDRAALDRLAARNEGADLYLLDYLDYRSEDGFFRKYRFFFVGDAILPYHLAIGTGWKVHHVTTGMADDPALQREEEAFLAAPEQVFEAQHFAALEAIRKAIGLDFFGIDCALDRERNLVVFETNASMLVHDSNHAFPYKSPYARRIKAAFADLLDQRRDRAANS